MDQSLLTIKDRIELEQKKWLESKLFRGRWKSIRASGIGDICTRRIFYYMTCGELADEITTDLVAIFEEGKDQEPGVRRFLSELGFEINKSGTTETMDTHGISGQVDGTLVVNGTRYIVEIKTVSEFAWEKLNEPKDLDEGYYKKWYAQMQTYLMLFNYERGLFILKRKAAKQVKVIEIDDQDFLVLAGQRAHCSPVERGKLLLPARIQRNSTDIPKPLVIQVRASKVSNGGGPVANHKFLRALLGLPPA